MKQSTDLFDIHRKIFLWTGVSPPIKYLICYYGWSFLFNGVIVFFYPIHLIAGLFDVDSTEELFNGLAIVFSCLACSIKYSVFCYYMDEIRHMQHLFATLDNRIQTADEKELFKSIFKSCKVMLICYVPIYVGSSLFPELAFLLEQRNTLLFPGWLPIDWRASKMNFWIANMYQFLGLALEIVCDYAVDTLPPVSLALLCGHVRLLYLRVSKLGTDPEKSISENNKELKLCAKDHKILIELQSFMQKILSYGTFFQIFVTGINLCCTIIYCVYFATSGWSYLYYVVLILGQAMEIFPSCYYGSVFEVEFKEIAYALFSCNWMDQDKAFKKTMTIFCERCFQPTTFYAMFIFRIHLDTFYVTMKSAYSLFTVVLQAK